MTVQHIHDAVRTGKITPEHAAMLIELRRELERRRRRRIFWRGFLDGYSLGPVRRWIARLWRQWRSRR